MPVGEVFPRYAETELCFTTPDKDRIIETCDVVFLALPHGLAAEYAIPFVKGGLKVIDISADFRLKSTEKYKFYYKKNHPAPEMLETAVYGLPELRRSDIAEASLIACPGCYPTSILLPSIPLLKNGLVSSEGIIASSMSGVTGAGRKVDSPYIFPECNESLRAYAPAGHRHLPEIEQELAFAVGRKEVKMNFVPHLVPVNRGINSTLFFNMEPGCSVEKIEEAYREAYSREYFARVLKAGRMPDTKNVTMTNFCEMGFSCDEHTGKVIVAGSVDNLTKGASGQAVQCMNIIFGIEESEGLI
jgi:N-acetyl-gamma-glutamyl-phosphate reductase